MVTSISESTRLWEKALKKIQEKIDDKKAFDSWFEKSYIYEVRGNVISVVVDNKVAKTLLSNQYSKLIQSVVNDLTDDEYIIKFYTEDELESKPTSIKVKATEKEEDSEYFKDAKLHSNLTFDNFVVGDFNKEAHKAALYVAKNGGTLFNPLFIYSHSGLGKTHLLHAIGNEILANRMPNAKILYITANDFVEEYIRFVKAEKTDTMKDFFKGVDVLLIDDIQFLADKVKTEEMFFYVYQDMINKGRRVIITSDKQPNSLKGLEDRLITRFTQGLTVKINDPNRDACVAILKKKITESGLDINKVDENVIYFLADKFSKDIRELEGAVNKLLFNALSLDENDTITMDVAIKAIGSLKGGKAVADQLSEQKIINTVAEYYNLTPSMLTSKTRTGQIALARHIAMYLIRKHLDVPLKKIGDAFGGKDHTTVMSGIEKVEKELKTDEQLRKAIEELEQRLSK